MNHPCLQASCPEWYNGECFGMGCARNPLPEPVEDAREDESQKEAV